MSRRINNQSEAAGQLDSSTLLSKLDKLSAQMEIAFPPTSSSSKKDTNIDYLHEKSPTKKKTSLSQSISNTPTVKILSSSVTQGSNENKENINANEKSINHEIGRRSSESNSVQSSEKEPGSLNRNNANNNSSNSANEQHQITSTENTTPTTSNNTPTNKLSAWKRTKILSKTLSSMEVIKAMKSKTAASVQPILASTTNQQPQQNLKPKNDENTLKKSSSGNLSSTLDNHHLNSPLNQIKRRSQEEVGTGLGAARLSSSLTSSVQTSIHNLNDTTKLNSQVVLQAALNNLNQNTGAYQIPNNYNTNIINQLNKNYLKNIQKQKARSDWKSLKSKLIGLARRDSDEETQNDKKIENSELANSANQRKLSNPNQSGDDGIICKKEDLLFLLRNSNLKNKQRRSNKPSLADVVVQLQENKAKDKINQGKNQNTSSETSIKAITSTYVHAKENNTNQSKMTTQETSTIVTSSVVKGKNANSNGRVQFVLSPSTSEQNTSTSLTPKIKSSLKKTSTVSNSIEKEKNNSIRQTKSNTINNCNLNKKKVKIFETNQDGIRKGLIIQSVKDRTNNSESVSNDENEENDSNDENQFKGDSENQEVNEEHHKVKWDDSNVIDAGLLGNAIQAFLSSITTNATTSTSFSPATTSSKHHLGPTEKKVSFKKS